MMKISKSFGNVLFLSNIVNTKMQYQPMESDNTFAVDLERAQIFCVFILKPEEGN